MEKNFKTIDEQIETYKMQEKFFEKNKMGLSLQGRL